MSSALRRVILAASAITLVAAVLTALAALGLMALPWLAVYLITAALLAALSVAFWLTSTRTNRIVGVVGLVVSLGYVVVMGLSLGMTDPVLAGGFIAVPYLVLQGLMPLTATVCGAWGLVVALRRPPRS